MTTYHERERERRFAIYVKRRLHTETADFQQHVHICNLLRADGVKNSDIHVLSLNGNQKTREQI